MKSKNLFATTTMPNGNLVVAEDTVIKIFNPHNFQEIQGLQGHVKTIYALCPSKDGNTLLSAGKPSSSEGESAR